MKTQTLEELLHEIYLCGVDENPFGEEDKTKEVLQLFKQAGEVAVEEYSKKVLSILDKAEMKKVFDMPDTTENWRNWKGIRNSITNLLKEK